MILALDTSSSAVSAALLRGGRLIAESFICNRLTHSQVIMPLIDEVLSRAEATPRMLEKIVCVAGPGSFTGVRIGVATARAMAFALSVPAVPVDALEALCMNLPHARGVVCPMLDARRDQVYTALFGMDSGLPERLHQDRALPVGEWIPLLPAGKIVFIGDGAEKNKSALAEALGERALFAPAHLGAIRASAAAALSLYKPDCAPDALRPIYLRLPQAERELLKKEASPNA